MDGHVGSKAWAIVDPSKNTFSSQGDSEEMIVDVFDRPVALLSGDATSDTIKLDHQWMSQSRYSRYVLFSRYGKAQFV